jgi:hypothetical protein
MKDAEEADLRPEILGIASDFEQPRLHPPASAGTLALQNKRLFYGLLLRASAQALHLEEALNVAGREVSSIMVHDPTEPLDA